MRPKKEAKFKNIAPNKVLKIEISYVCKGHSQYGKISNDFSGKIRKEKGYGTKKYF